MNTAARELLVMFSTPVYIVIIGIEIIISNWQGKKYYSFRDTVTNLSLMILASCLELMMMGIYFFVLYFFYKNSFFEIQNKWLYWILLLIAEDFLFYWLHYLEHHSRFFWAVHSTHHSSEKFNLTVGFRSSVFQPLYRFVFFIPLAFLGFKIPDIILMYSATQIWGILVHTEYVGKLGFLEYIFVTPSNHRVHHASNVKYLDKNIGMTFIIWDKLFGTFQHEENNEPIKYGLTKAIDDSKPTEILFHEWKEIIGDMKQKVPFSTKISYLFSPPGWSHDGSRKTSRQLQEEISG